MRSSYECAPVYCLRRLSKWLAQTMTLPACSFPPYDPLRKVLQQVAIPTAYVTFLVAIILALFSLVALLVAATPCTAVCKVTRISVLVMGHTLCGRDVQTCGQQPSATAIMGHTSLWQRCADVRTAAVSHSCNGAHQCVADVRTAAVSHSCLICGGVLLLYVSVHV